MYIISIFLILQNVQILSSFQDTWVKKIKLNLISSYFYKFLRGVHAGDAMTMSPRIYRLHTFLLGVP